MVRSPCHFTKAAPMSLLLVALVAAMPMYPQAATRFAEREAAAAAAVEEAVANLKTAQALLDSIRSASAAAGLKQQQEQEQQEQQQNSINSSRSGAVAGVPACPQHLTTVDHFAVNGTNWTACEDLAVPGGALVLLSADGNSEWFSKSHEPFIQGADSDYYLGLGKKAVLAAKTDLLGNTILSKCQAPNPASKLCEPTWGAVERALPVMRSSGENGVRTFVGSRSSSVDATFSDKATDLTTTGFPPVQSYVMNLSAVAAGEPPIHDFSQYINWSFVADGLVGGVEPNVVFYFPIMDNYTTSWSSGARYWTMVASPVADMKGGREQSVWFRFQQITCTNPAETKTKRICTLHNKPQYWDTYSASYSPVGQWVPPEYVASASGFYENLLLTRYYWRNTIKDEGMAELELPSVKGGATNGTWLVKQAVHSIVRSMISRDDTWHGRYGVLPGYGLSMQDGFQDTFTATMTGALEMGSMPYARGVMDNWLRYYIRPNGGPTYRGEETAVQSRMLTLFALYVSYSGAAYTPERKEAEAFLLSHFSKAKALGEWLMFRYNKSLVYPPNHPSHGIPAGDDEADCYIFHMYSNASAASLSHFYSSAAEMYRGFAELGAVWVSIGKSAARPDVSAHGAQLLATAPKLYDALHRSLKATTVNTNNTAAPRCLPTVSARTPGAPWGPSAEGVCDQWDYFRTYNEMLYSGALTVQQIDDVYSDLALGNKTLCQPGSTGGTEFCRPMTLGCTGYDEEQTTYTAYGMAYGLLNADMVERFLLHWFGMSAHTYTRGSWTVPEAVNPDRDVGNTDYIAAGMMTSPSYLSWALKFEDLESKTLWLAKATPREWLRSGAAPLVANRLTSRYGRISYTLAASGGSGSGSVGGGSGGGAPRTPYTVRANVTLPAGFGVSGASQPAGGLRLRLRVPVAHAGKLPSVTVGGKFWKAVDPAAETVDFAAAALSPQVVGEMESIVATFA
eukprot:gene12126-30363_t